MTRAAPDDFHVLRRRVRLDGQLTTRTGLRIGSGSGGLDDAVDLPVLTDAGGYPFVPGASLKGVLRSTLEALVRGAGGDAAKNGPWWACDPLRDPCVDLREQERNQIDTTGHCAICRLFGSHVVASHVRISDAMMLDRDGPPPIELRDGVSIDRDLGTVYKGQKYDFQVVAPGTRFQLEVFADNVDDAQLGLLMAGFDQIAEGFSALGGFTSRGLGRVELEWTGVVDFDPGTLLSGIDAIRAASADGPMTDDARRRWREALAASVEGGA